MARYCPACDNKIGPDEVNVKADIAKCLGCGEVFRSSAAPACIDAPAPPGEVPAALRPETKIRVDDDGRTLRLALPAQGWGVTLLIPLAITVFWWGCLAFVIGRSIAESPRADEAPRDDPLPAEETGREERSGMILAGLFIAPFFLVGFAMLFGILAHLFGCEMLRLDPGECSYRWQFFGLGRTRRAALDGVSLRWIEEGLLWHADKLAWRSPHMAGAEAHILLALGAWEGGIGGAGARNEQAYIYRLMKRRLDELQTR